MNLKFSYVRDLLNKIKFLLVAIIICFIQQTYGNSEYSSKTTTNQEQVKSLEIQNTFNIIPDNRPSDYEYAVLSEHVYGSVKQGDIVKIKQEEWQVISIKKGKNDYFGILYKNEQKKQFVLAHRGTQGFGGLIEDIQGIILKKLTAQHQAAHDFTEEAVKYAKNSNYHLSATGHSLGALLAELSVYWCDYEFVYRDINAVTFESPGSNHLLKEKFFSHLDNFDLKKLDIVQYLSYPNLINTWGYHIGTIYHIQPKLENFGWIVGLFIKRAHSISGIIKAFEEDISQTRVLMKDWPIGLERTKYFKNAMFQQGRFSLNKLNKKQIFELMYEGHYATDKEMDLEKQIWLKHFNSGIREFLTDFFQRHKYLLTEGKNNKELVNYWQNNGVPDSIINLIVNYSIDGHSTHARIATFTDLGIQNWRREISTQLAKHSNLIPQLLYPFDQMNFLLSSPIRSDLILPVESVMLDRPTLIDEIGEKFKRDEGIQTIALTGIGGSGKTTIARQYARKQQTMVIWEINAETEEVLKESFESLAQALAKTEENQKKLMKIKQIQNLKEREDRIISFVKEGLRINSNWFLIYDNVENFTDIQKYFPKDVKTWGEGQIILTTRNSTIQDNKWVNHTINIGELDNEQKYDIFAKIMKHGSAFSDNATDIEKGKKFLEVIPPFPLDISIAAYYLKETNTSFEEYRTLMEEYKPGFSNLQESIIREKGDYNKTRHSIIAMSLERMIAQNKDFIELILFISILDSQNIPKVLLDKYKDNLVAGDFIRHLKKYSLITGEAKTYFGATISLHRSIQDVMLGFLRKRLVPKTTNDTLEKIIEFLGKYLDHVIAQEDFQKLRGLILHCETLLSRKTILTNGMAGIIGSKLGGIYCRLEWNSAEMRQELLHDSIKLLEKNYPKYYEHIAQNLIYQGILYWTLEDLDQAQQSLEHSLQIYQKHFGARHNNIPQLLVRLGYTEAMRGNHRKAGSLYEQGLKLYKQQKPIDYMQIAWTVTCIADLNRRLGNYKHAESFLMENIDLHNKDLIKSHRQLSWISTVLGQTYRGMGQYDKALVWFKRGEELAVNDFTDGVSWNMILLADFYRRIGNYIEAKWRLEKAYDICNKYYQENHSASCAVRLGVLYAEIGDYEKAEQLIKYGLTFYEKYRGKNNFANVWIMVNLGNLYTNISNYDQAKELLTNALKVYKQHLKSDHIKISWVLYLLGKAHMLSGNLLKAKELLSQSLENYKKHYGKDHIETARVILSLGQNYLESGELNIAKHLINDAYTIFYNAKYPDCYIALELLAELNIKRAVLLTIQGNKKEANMLHTQSIKYLQEALQVINKYFPNPESATQSIRIRTMISKLEQLLK